MPQHLGKTEVLKERDDIGERFMKGERVRICRLQKFRKNRIEQCVRRFMRDDVMRQTGEDHSAWKLRAPRLGGRWKVTKEQRLFLRTVIGVSATKGMRINAQSPNE